MAKETNNSIQTYETSQIAGEDIANDVLKTENRFTYLNISTATTTQVKTGVGVMSLVTINSKGTVASTITIYDNTTSTGTPIAIVDSLNMGGTFIYNVAFTVGLRIVTTGTVAPNITVSYR